MLLGRLNDIIGVESYTDIRSISRAFDQPGQMHVCTSGYIHIYQVEISRWTYESGAWKREIEIQKSSAYR